MRLHSYRDESHSRHFDLIGGGGHPWSIDLVSRHSFGHFGRGLRLCAHGPLGPLDPGGHQQPAGFGRRAASVRRLAPSGCPFRWTKPPPSEG